MGYLSGALLGACLGCFLNLSVAIILSMALTGALTFFALAFWAKVITGEEYIVYYHHEIAILTLCFLVLKLLRVPALVYLDITILGIATFLAFGRVGCYSVGCCHGKPAKKGVIYGLEHVQAGFTPHYQGVSLLPVQLFESAFVFLITVAGTWLLLRQSKPGTVLILYTIVYGTFRFMMEFFRGDPGRPYWNGFSEAQWTTLALFLFSAALSLAGWLPFYSWHLWTVLGLLFFMLAVAIYRRQQTAPIHKINNPRHVAEIADGLKALVAVENDAEKVNGKWVIPIFKTSLGVKISAGQADLKNGRAAHYTLSGFDGNEGSAIKFNRQAAGVLGKIIQALCHHNEPFEIRAGKSNVYHVIFRKTR